MLPICSDRCVPVRACVCARVCQACARSVARLVFLNSWQRSIEAVLEGLLCCGCFPVFGLAGATGLRWDVFSIASRLPSLESSMLAISKLLFVKLVKLRTDCELGCRGA